MLLTLCMIVRDEEAELTECLRSAKDAVDEIVIADTGSTDRSRDVARSFGAVVIESPWEGDFAKARNTSLTAAHGNWVLVLDADERLDGDPETLRRWLRRTTAIAAMVPIRNLLANGREERHSAVRLFRRLPGVRYERKLHEQVAPSLLAARPQGPIAKAPLSIVHRGYLPQYVHDRGKRARNLQLAQEEVAERPTDPFAAYALGVEFMAQGSFDAAADELRRARELAGVVEPWQSRLFKLEVSALSQAGRDDDARRLVLEALRHFPRFTDLHYFAGVLFVHAGMFREAERHLRRAVSLGPAATPPYDGADPRLGAAQAWRTLGRLLGELGRPDEALQALRKAIRLEPDDLTHVQALVEIQLSVGRPARQLWQTPPPGALEVAATLYRLGEWQDALEAFGQARRMQPSLPEHLHLLEALCHVHRHEASKAWPHLRAALPSAASMRRDAVEQVAFALGLRGEADLLAAGLPKSVAEAIAALASELALPAETQEGFGDPGSEGSSTAGAKR